MARMGLTCVLTYTQFWEFGLCLARERRLDLVCVGIASYVECAPQAAALQNIAVPAEIVDCILEPKT